MRTATFSKPANHAHVICRLAFKYKRKGDMFAKKLNPIEYLTIAVGLPFIWSSNKHVGPAYIQRRRQDRNRPYCL